MHGYVEGLQCLSLTIHLSVYSGCVDSIDNKLHFSDLPQKSLVLKQNLQSLFCLTRDLGT